MIKLAIFDVDGTLIDSESIYIKAALLNNEINNYNVPMDVIKNTIGRNRDSVRQIVIGSQSSNFDYDTYRSKLMELYDEDSLTLKKGAINILEYCKTHNILSAVATSTYKEKQLRILNKLDLTKYFDYMVFGDQIKNSKPAPDIYLDVFNHYNFKKEDILIFEDSRNGILSAHSANINVVYIKDVVDVEKEVVDLAYKSIKDLDEGIKLL